jgi:hypothetical protein
MEFSVASLIDFSESFSNTLTISRFERCVLIFGILLELFQEIGVQSFIATFVLSGAPRKKSDVSIVKDSRILTS